MLDFMQRLMHKLLFLLGACFYLQILHHNANSLLQRTFFIKDCIAENEHEYYFFIVPVVPERHAPQTSQYSEK